MSTSDTQERIVNYIRDNNQARVSDLVRALSPLGRVGLHRQLKKMIVSGAIKKIGKPPIVYYLLSDKKKETALFSLDKGVTSVIENNYLYISPQGEILPGVNGFVQWATNTKQTDKIASLAALYVETRSLYDTHRASQGWINATHKLVDTFPHVCLNKLLYADFYSLPQFGKTKLGAMMLYAKQSQNRELIGNVTRIIKPLVKSIMSTYKVDAVAYIPPSIPRTLQFMREMAAYLNSSLPTIDLVKTRTGPIIVAQKTLEKLNERVANARDTIFIKNKEKTYNTILLIDDAVGSGASMNETAMKLIEQTGASKIIGFAVVGSFKGFEIIREV